MNKKLFLLCFPFLTLLPGCVKLDPKIAAPSYIQIDNYAVITDTATQGTNNQKFTDVLVTSSTTNYGYYPIPGKISIPLTGNTYLSIRPVIKVNGVNALRIDYPLMKGSDTTISLVAGQVTKCQPIFKYYPTVNFYFKENFENTLSQMIDMAGSSDTFSVHPDYTQHFDGKCLGLVMNSTHTTFTVQSQYALPLPHNGTNVYLEINYKANAAFETGLIGTDSPQGVITSANFRSAGGGKPSADWNKLYINFTDILRTPPVSAYYYLYFYSTYDGSTTTNQIYIDNIKVIGQH